MDERETNENSSCLAAVQSAKLRAIPVIEANDSVGQTNSGIVHSENVGQSMHRKHHPKTRATNEGGAQGSACGSRLVKTDQASVSNLRKPTLIADMKRPRSLENAWSSQSNARPRSGLGKAKPAHTTAPFKTDPNLHMPKRQANKTVPAVMQRNSWKSHIRSGNGKYQTKILPPIPSKRDQSPSSTPDAQVDTHLADTCDMPTSATGAGGEEGVGTRTAECLTSHELTGESLSSEMSNLTLLHNPLREAGSTPSDARAAHSVKPSENPEQKQDTKLFSLMADGYALSYYYYFFFLHALESPTQSVFSFT